MAESTDFVPTSMLAAPLFEPDGEVLGVLEVLDPTADQSSDWTLAVLGTLASQLAAIVVVSRRHQDGPGQDRLARLGRDILAAVESYRSPGPA